MDNDGDRVSRRVAWCGLGDLGARVCDALLQSAHQVAVYDPRQAAMAPRVALGARAASSAADAARDADVLAVIVRDDDQVREAVMGTDGLLAGASPDAVLVLHSTVAPATVREVGEACAAAGIRVIDAGLSTGGGRPMTELYAMCGGDPEHIAAARPVMQTYCTDIVRFGPLGAGMAAKLVRNAMRYAMFGVLYEGMAFAEAAGLDLGAMAHLYRATFGTCSDDEAVISRSTMVPGALDDPTLDRSYVERMSSSITLGWKDLDDAFHLAAEVGFDVPVARAARPFYGPALGLALYEEVVDHGGHTV